MSCGGRGGGEGAIRGRRVGRAGGGGETEEEEEALRVSWTLLDAFRPGRSVADMPSRREPILGKKEHSVVGLFSAGRGDVGGRIGASDEEDKDEAIPGGVRGVRGAEEGREGLEAVSSVELNESLLKGVYLVLGTSSISLPSATRLSVQLRNEQARFRFSLGLAKCLFRINCERVLSFVVQFRVYLHLRTPSFSDRRNNGALSSLNKTLRK